MKKLLIFFNFFCILNDIQTVDCKDKQEVSDTYSLKMFSGEDVKQIFPLFEKLHLTDFREYPYLYVGNSEEIYNYFLWFCSQKYSAAAVAYYNGEIVGFITGEPLECFDEYSKAQARRLFEIEGIQISDLYYFGEAFVLKEHRGHKISEQLHELMCDHAKGLGYAKACFLYESHESHPLKPGDYKKLDPLFLCLGYIKSKISVHLNWNTVQADSQIKDQEHILAYWIKDLV